MAGMRYRTGAVFAVVVFILGVTAAVASGWENAGETKEKVTHEVKGDEGGKDDNDKGKSKDDGDRSKSGDRDNGDRDKEKGKGKDDRDKDDGDNDNGEDKDKPTVTTPSTPPAPTTVQTTPSTPLTPLSPAGTPSGPGEGDEPELAQASPDEEESGLAPVSERKKLAATGLHPGLIALLGAVLIGGGVVLFRRAFAR